jgi:hypothetical protein
MSQVTTRFFIVACLFFALTLLRTDAFSQRAIGARELHLDNNGNTVALKVAPSLQSSYTLQLPSIPPPYGINYFRIDASGNLTWTDNTLPPLAPGNIWVGNSSGVSVPLPPGTAGSIFMLDASLQPIWSTTIPSVVMVPASQIGSGTLPIGTTIDVGNGAIIQPSGTGKVIANGLTGSGVDKFSGTVMIPLNAISINVSYPEITASSIALVSVVDPTGQTVQVSVTGISVGVGFSVMFSGFYPTTTGTLNYLVIN